MKVLEKYSLDCGILPEVLEKPKIYSSFIPVKFEKYITVSNSKDQSGKSYPYFQEVIDQIKDDLKSNGIDILQIGANGDQVLEGCESFTGNISINQAAYIEGGSSLYIGNSSEYALSHLCENKKPKVLIPTLSNSNDFNYVFPDWGTVVSIGGEQENWPNPELVASRILKELEIKQSFIYETIYMGSKYPKKTIDVVPNRIVSEKFLSGQSIIFRFDFLDLIKKQNVEFGIVSSIKRPSVFVTDKVFDLEPFMQSIGKHRVSGLVFNFKDIRELEEKAQFCQEAIRAGLKVSPATAKGNLTEDEVNLVKLALIDVAPLSELEETSWEEVDKDKINEDTIIKSSRYVFSEAELFLSKQAFLEGAASEENFSQKIKGIKGLTNLGKELEYSYIFNKTNNTEDQV
jgi:hypothetical protein